MTDTKWTKARVVKAYKEWAALTDRARDIGGELVRMGDPAADVLEISLPGWRGAGWPGHDMEFVDWYGNDQSFEMALLWDSAALDNERRVRAAYAQSEKAEQERARDLAELARLKAKYEGTP